MVMNAIVVPELWNNRIFPEGHLLCWLVADGAPVRAGQSVALLRVEGKLHELPAHRDGRICIQLGENSRIHPGSLLGQIETAHEAARLG